MVRLLPGDELVEPTHVTIDIEESSRFWLYTLSRYLGAAEIEEILDQYEWFLAATLLLNEQSQHGPAASDQRAGVGNWPRVVCELATHKEPAET